jgi:hypothetical protein
MFFLFCYTELFHLFYYIYSTLHEMLTTFRSRESFSSFTPFFRLFAFFLPSSRLQQQRTFSFIFSPALHYGSVQLRCPLAEYYNLHEHVPTIASYLHISFRLPTERPHPERYRL